MVFSRTATPLLFGTALTLALGFAAPTFAEDLNVGFIAPMTGGFAQVGKDMVDGFQLYLDEVNGDFAGAQVKLIVGGVLASTGYALAPVSTAEKTVYLASVPASDDLTQRDAAKYPYFFRT